ncbi:response regulator transcription factor [Methylosinus sp. Sm6]|uniref:response regulator transcription factor n=1 Tax=Methylosinus sp. Sm6 TaxID=2866948 RepID=UPI001C9904D5|nr:response regulator transcription factor [Methylosinus sp. Sm6]MBY6240830.1 response regulator transcription factor [Methylosinus sp. Sm6]
MRILLVEDHPGLAKEISWRVRQAGLPIDHVTTLGRASSAIAQHDYSIALVDRRLPDGDGLSLIREIRARRAATHILMLSALDAVDDRIEGLDAGADDYLTKPFSLDEMLARVRAHLRRAGDDRARSLRMGVLSFDVEKRSVSVAGRPISLLRRELMLLEALLQNANCVVSRDALLSHVYGLDATIQEHALTALVSRLRARLAKLDAGVEIHLARGLGYLIADVTPKGAA